MLIPLKLVRDQQLQQQIFDQLRDLIVSDRLRPGSRMPSSRMMAEQFSISRMTVLLTYERLIAEGYLETRPAAGTFVARPPTPLAAHQAADASALALAHLPAVRPPHRPDATTPPDVPPGQTSSGAEPRVGGADPSLFPTQRWRSLVRQGLDRLGTHIGAEHASGCPALRDAIASWLSTSRGIAVGADQVMLVKSRQQALHVIAHLASRPCEGRRNQGRAQGSVHQESTHQGTAHQGTAHQGTGQGGATPGPGQHNGCPVVHDGVAVDERARIVVEDPCDPAAAAALGAGGARLLRVAVDADGLRTDHLPEGDAALIHVTPEHQRPLGVVLSRDRRGVLLDWAARNGALILEEDIDGELRYGDMIAPPLICLDRSERVIMLGGFSVSLGPWLDLAYLVLPRWLVPFAQVTRRLIDDSRAGLEQTALAEFMGGGGYARHLHRLSKAYASRRDTMLDALRRHLGATGPVWGLHAGLHLAWRPDPELGSAAGLAALARRLGLDATAPREDVILLGFGVSDERHIESGVRRLAEALTGALDGLAPVAALSATRTRPVAQRALN